MSFLLPDTVIAFSASLANPITVSGGDIIKFEYEFIDTHNMHNPNVGYYTIPQSGIYEVNVNLYKGGSSSYNDAVADLYVNEVLLTRIWNRYADSPDRAHSSCSIIHEFTIGNTLYVQAGIAGSYYGEPSVSFSQFNIKYLGAAPGVLNTT